MTEALLEMPARAGEEVAAEAVVPPRAAGSLEGFLARVIPQGYRFARACALDHEAALDAVQTSGLRLIERYATRPEAEWPALFFAILRNSIHDTRRWRLRWSLPWRRAEREDRGGDIEESANAAAGGTAGHESEEGAPTAEARYTRSRQRRALEAALASLPLRQRQVFLLREWQGFSVEETARILGCTAGAVKQHHFRALKALRGRLMEVWHDEA
jgi:RNA polymerase sigma-70 factor (ECF subfamily)